MKLYLTCFLFLFLFAGYANAQFLPDAQIAAKQKITGVSITGSGPERDSIFVGYWNLDSAGNWNEPALKEELVETRLRHILRDSLGRIVFDGPRNHKGCFNDTVGCAYFYGSNNKVSKTIYYSCEKGKVRAYYHYDKNDSLYLITYSAYADMAITREDYFRNDSGRLDSVLYWFTMTPDNPTKDSAHIKIASAKFRYRKDGLLENVQVFDSNGAFYHVRFENTRKNGVEQPCIFRYTYSYRQD